jgi:shikimate kinase
MPTPIIKIKKWLESIDKNGISLVFIGMSGSGKSYWSKEISQFYGLERIELDEMIGSSLQLASILANYSGQDSAEKMGKYLGMPWENDFNEKERLFLNIEAEIMRNIRDKNPPILDLTGSAIYHANEMQALSSSGLVIYLETDEAAEREMFETFMSSPKPVCWKGHFKPQPGESNEEALARCYPLLLKSRDALYSQYADVTLPFETHKRLKTPEAFMAEVINWLGSTKT